MANMKNNLTIKNGKNAGKNVGTKSVGRGMAGDPGKSMPSRAFEGPTSTGGPIALKRALAKKTLRGGDATGFAGMTR